MTEKSNLDWFTSPVYPDQPTQDTRQTERKAKKEKHKVAILTKLCRFGKRDVLKGTVHLKMTNLVTPNIVYIEYEGLECFIQKQ